MNYPETAENIVYTPGYMDLYKRRKEVTERVFADTKNMQCGIIDTEDYPELQTGTALSLLQ